MKKRVWSLFLSLVLCVSVTSGDVYAQTYDAGNSAASSSTASSAETNTTAESSAAAEKPAAAEEPAATENPVLKTVSENNGSTMDGDSGVINGAAKDSQESMDEQVEAVQKLIDALPTPESLKTADQAEREAAYCAVQEAYEAYEALTEEQQDLLTGTERFEALFSWFNEQIEETGETELCNHIMTSSVNTVTTLDDGTATCKYCGELEASVSKAGIHIFYCTLSEAVAAAEADAVITLHKDVVLESDLTIDKASVALDLRQRTLSLDNCNLRIAATGVSIMSGVLSAPEMGKIEQSAETTDSTKGWVVVGGGTEDASLYLQSGTVEKVSVEDNGYFSLTQTDEPRDSDDPTSEPWYAKVGTLHQSGSGDVYFDGGSITKEISGSMTIQEMLGEMHGLQYEDGTWLKVEVLDGNTLTLQEGSSVKVVDSPLNMMTLDPEFQEVPYGISYTPDIRVDVDKAEGYGSKQVTYTWYLDGVEDEYQTGATYTFPEEKPVKTKRGATEAEDTLEPYVVKCVASCDGYERSASTEITVQKAELSQGEILVNATANEYSCTYNTKSQSIQDETVMVRWRSNLLVKGTDYVIDTEASELTATDAGSYLLQIKAARGGNYTGEAQTHWKIEPLVLTADDCMVEFEQDSFPYTGSEIKPAVTVTYTYGGEKITIPAEEYTVDYLDNVELGTAMVRIYNAEDGNYEVSGEGYFEITKAEISPKPEVIIENWSYGENAKLPGITANPGYGDVEYYYNTTDSNQNGNAWDVGKVGELTPGDYYVYAVIEETTYYKGCTTEAKKFTVEKTAVPVDEWPTLKDIYVGDTLDKTYLVGGECSTADGRFSIQGTYCWDTSGIKEVTVAYTLAAPNDTYRQTTTKTITINVIKRIVGKVEGLVSSVTDKAFGTPLAGLGLPEEVVAVATNGMGTIVPVTWSGYDPSTLEPQTLTGTLDLSEVAGELQQPAQEVKAEITVTLQPAVVQQPSYADKSVTYNAAGQGNPIEKPVGVASVSYEYEGKNGTVYEKSKTAPTDAGNYTVTASFTMAYGYQQLAPVSAALTIGTLDLSSAEVILGAELFENGKEQEQTVTAVKVGGVTLRTGDYTISDNTGTAEGSYEMTITGTGNCTGEVKKAWKIAAGKSSQTGGTESGSTSGSESTSGSGSTSGSEDASGSGSGNGGVTPSAASEDWKDVNHTLTETSNTGKTQNAAYPENGNVDVSIPGANVIPSYVLETLRGTNLTLALHQGNGAALSISGRYLKKGSSLLGMTALDLTMNTDSDQIPAELIRGKQAAAHRQLTIKDTGRFPVTVDLHVNVGAENAGRYANFYRYNEELGRLEYMGSFRITQQGQAMTALSRGGSYLVTVTDTIPRESGCLAVDVYTVKKGDTLSRIALRCRMTVKELLAENPEIKNSNRIRIGQKIRIGK